MGPALTAGDDNGASRLGCDVAAPDLSIQEPAKVMNALARARSDLLTADDSALEPLVEAAERLTAQWRARCDAVEASWHAYDEALMEADQSRRRLDLVLRTLAELSQRPRVAQSNAPSGRPEERFGSLATGVVETRQATAGAEVGSRAADVDVAIFLLGQFKLLLHGKPIEAWPGTKAPRVARYLFAHRSRAIPREQLIELFWPGANLESGRRNLHQAIYGIRRALRCQSCDGQFVVYTNDAYAISPTWSQWSDVEEFEAFATAGRQSDVEGDSAQAFAAYARAEHCYAGDFIDDSPYEEWTQAERERLRLIYADVANRLADLHFSHGEIEAALELSRRLLRRDPCDEASHRRALRCYARLGNRTQLVTQYKACSDALERTHGLQPATETAGLFQTLLGS